MKAPPRGGRRLLLSGVAALLLALPCWWLLDELAYAVHPSYTHTYGEIPRSFLSSSADRLRFIVIAAFIVGFTLLQESCLKYCALARRRWISAAVAVLGLTAAVEGLVLAAEGPILLRPGYALKSLYSVFVWLLPWITYGYLARLYMIWLESLWEQLAVYLGSLLLLSLIVAGCSAAWGDMDGTGQAIFAGLAAIPMSSIIAGGLSGFIASRQTWRAEPAQNHTT